MTQVFFWRRCTIAGQPVTGFSGMRLMQACRLRIKDVDTDRKQIMVRDGKRDKDRRVPLAEKLIAIWSSNGVR